MKKFILTIFLILINFSAHSAENILISDIKIEGLQREEDMRARSGKDSGDMNAPSTKNAPPSYDSVWVDKT